MIAPHWHSHVGAHTKGKIYAVFSRFSFINIPPYLHGNLLSDNEVGQSEAPFDPMLVPVVSEPEVACSLTASVVEIFVANGGGQRPNEAPAVQLTIR